MTIYKVVSCFLLLSLVALPVSQPAIAVGASQIKPREMLDDEFARYYDELNAIKNRNPDQEQQFKRLYSMGVDRIKQYESLMNSRTGTESEDRQYRYLKGVLEANRKPKKKPAPAPRVSVLYLRPIINQKLSESHRKAGAEVLRVLRKLKSATAVGLSVEEYRTRLIDTKIEFEEKMRAIPQGSLHWELGRSIDAYSDAAKMWESSFEFDGPDAFTSINGALLRKYGIDPAMIVKNFGGRPLTVNGRGFFLSVVWMAAEQHQFRAEQIIKASLQSSAASPRKTSKRRRR